MTSLKRTVFAVPCIRPGGVVIKGKKTSIAVIFLIVLGGIIYVSGTYLNNSSHIEKSRLTISDQVGRIVYIPEKTERVVSLWPEATRILVALGEGEKIVGISNNEQGDPILSKIFPKLKTLPGVGDAEKGTCNIEELISLKPDVIFLFAEYADIADDIQNKTGIPVVCISLCIPATGGVFDYSTITLIGDIMQKEERAGYLKKYLEDKIAKVKKAVFQIPEDKKVKGIMIDPDMFVGGFRDPLDSAGIVNTGLNISLWWYQVNPEQVIAWQPDYVFLCLHLSAHSDALEKQYHGTVSNSQWQKIKAVQNGNILILVDYCWSWYPSLMAIDVLRTAKTAYPDIFKTLDIEKEGNEIFKVLYGSDDFFTNAVVRQYMTCLPEKKDAQF